MSKENTTTARITCITIGPDWLRTPWTHAVASGVMPLRYRITAITVMPGEIAPVELDIYTPAGVWKRGEKTQKDALPMIPKDIEGVVQPVEFNEWVEKRSEYGAFPIVEDGVFIGPMDFEINGIKYDTPTEALEMFLSKGDGWRVALPEGSIEFRKEGDKVKMSEWTDKASGFIHKRIKAKVIGFDMSWLTPPPQREECMVTARLAHKRVLTEALGKPKWVR